MRHSLFSFQKKKRNYKGQSLIEMALILPVILLIIMAIVDFGLLFNSYMVINNAAREGARNAAIGSTDVKVSGIVEEVTGMLDQSRLTFTVTPSEALRKKGDEITVTVTYQNQLITPIISAIVSNPVQITAKAVMRME